MKCTCLKPVLYVAFAAGRGVTEEERLWEGEGEARWRERYCGGGIRGHSSNAYASLELSGSDLPKYTRLQRTAASSSSIGTWAFVELSAGAESADIWTEKRGKMMVMCAQKEGQRPRRFRSARGGATRAKKS